MQPKMFLCVANDEPVIQQLPQASTENLCSQKKPPAALLVVCMLCSWFHVSEQKMVNSGVTMITVSQQTDVEDANRGSGQAWLPSVP